MRDQYRLRSWLPISHRLFWKAYLAFCPRVIRCRSCHTIYGAAVARRDLTMNQVLSSWSVAIFTVYFMHRAGVMWSALCWNTPVTRVVREHIYVDRSCQNLNILNISLVGNLNWKFRTRELQLCPHRRIPLWSPDGPSFICECAPQKSAFFCLFSSQPIQCCCLQTHIVS